MRDFDDIFSDMEGHFEDCYWDSVEMLHMTKESEKAEYSQRENIFMRYFEDRFKGIFNQTYLEMKEMARQKFYAKRL